jgi:hypothetical protein
MPPQKKLRKHLKKISPIGVANCKLKKIYNKDLSKSQVIEILKSMSSSELHEIIHEISLSESQEITHEISSDELHETVHEISFNEPQEIIHETDPLISQNKIEKKRNELIEHVKNLPENQIINAYTLFSTMKYDKGNHCGEIYSPYIQKKAKEFVNNGIYKQYSSISSMQETISKMETKIHNMEKQKDITDLQLRSFRMKEVKAKEVKKNHISKLRSSIQKAKKITPNQLQNGIKNMIKENMKQYTPEFVQLVTTISNTGSISISSTVECTRAIIEFLTGKEPDHWISTGTISRWNKEVATLCLRQNCPKDTKSRFYSYGIMCDESTRGDKKIFLVCFAHWNEEKNQPTITIAKMDDLDKCNGNTVAKVVKKTCEENDINTKKCNFWLTDNTAYMSGSKLGAVVKFNLMCQSSSYRIPCGLHVLQIALVNFENTTFGKTNSPSGLSLEQPHPYYLLNLTYHLHDGYSDSNKESPLNMKSDLIRKLYWRLLQYPLKTYQKPISSRWLYQLTTAQQYLTNKDTHKIFAQWFSAELEQSQNVPSGYLKKWRVFLNWLEDSKLNIELECMVRFGEAFYEKVFKFLTGFDALPRVVIENGTKCLPLGNRAHEIPDKVLIWIDELKEAAENPESIFGKEFENAQSMLSNEEYNNLKKKIKEGMKKALESFCKWMECWIHFPLVICSLGGNNGPEFARAISRVFFSVSYNIEINLHEKNYIKLLEKDKSESINQSFGLLEALQEQDFLDEFRKFSVSVASDLHKFPLLYDFVKYRIWSIVVHQQQIEGLFNKYDIKTHPNMKKPLQESRMLLSSSNKNQVKITKENLATVRKEQREQMMVN